MSKADLLGPKSDAVSGARALLESRNRRATGKAMVEGEFAVTAALNAGWVESVYALPDDPILALTKSIRTYLVNERGLAALSDTVTSSGPIAVVNIPRYDLDQAVKTARFIVIADEISDPGNLGTLIRSAVAFGATALVTTTGSADLWSGKVLRSAAGNFTQIPLLSVTREQLLHELTAANLPLFVTAGEAAVEILDVPLQEPHAWVVGSEAHGVSQELKDAATHLVRIPTAVSVESLNAAVAGSICMYESGKALPRTGI